MCPRNFGLPIWKSLVPNWDTQLETTTEPDYEHCSEEGREKFLDMKVGLMVHWGLYTHLGTLESWAAYAENAPMWFMDIYYTLWQMWNPTDFDAGKVGFTSQTRSVSSLFRLHPNIVKDLPFGILKLQSKSAVGLVIRVM